MTSSQGVLPIASDSESHYRPDIDGLRAIAVLVVIFYHANFSNFPAGYIGVDIFFVISGYVITNTILRDSGSRQFSILGFYERRARRIIPALFTMLFAVVIASIIIEFPPDLKRTADGLLGVIGFTANFIFWQQSGYFAAAAVTKPLLHTWSLAVEEQFYLLYPAFLTFMLTRTPSMVRPAVVGLLLLSLLVYLLLAFPHANAAFFLSISRGWELLLGCALALQAARWHLSKSACEVLSAAGLVLLFVTVGEFPFHLDYPGMPTCIACIATGLLILANLRETATRRVLSWRPLVFVGTLSYSLYLWHWPLFAFARSLTLRNPPLNLTLLLLVTSFSLAYASWRWIERPFRAPGGVLKRRHLFVAAASAAGLLCATGIALKVSDGLASRLPAEVAAVLAFDDYGRNPQSTRLSRGSCNSGQMDFSDYDAATCLSPIPGQKNVLLWGDSHAAHMAQPLAGVVEGLGANFMQATKSECPPLFTDHPSQQCRAFTDLINLFQERKDVDVVILSAHWDETGDVLDETVQRFTRKGTHVILVGPSPEYQTALVAILARYLADGRPERGEPDRFLSEFVFEEDKSMRARYARLPGVSYVSLVDGLCTEQHCQTFTAAGVPIIWDTGHFTYEGADYAVRRTLADVIAHSLTTDPVVK